MNTKYDIGSTVSSRGMNRYLGFRGSMLGKDAHALLLEYSGDASQLVTIEPFSYGLVVAKHDLMRLILVGQETYWLTTYQIEDSILT